MIQKKISLYYAHRNKFYYWLLLSIYGIIMIFIGYYLWSINFYKEKIVNFLKTVYIYQLIRNESLYAHFTLALSLALVVITLTPCIYHLIKYIIINQDIKHRIAHHREYIKDAIYISIYINKSLDAIIVSKHKALHIYFNFFDALNDLSKRILLIQHNKHLYYSYYKTLLHQLDENAEKLYSSSKLQVLLHKYNLSIVQTIKNKPQHREQILAKVDNKTPLQQIPFTSRNVYAMLSDNSKTDNDDNIVAKWYNHHNNSSSSINTEKLFDNENLLICTSKQWKKIFITYKKNKSIEPSLLLKFIYDYTQMHQHSYKFSVGSKAWVWFYRTELSIATTMSDIFKQLVQNNNIDLLNKLIKAKYFDVFHSDYIWCQEQIKYHQAYTSQQEKIVNLCKKLCDMHQKNS